MNINFHYYIVKTLAFYSGIENESIQQKIAFYSQFVDDYYSSNDYPDSMLVKVSGDTPGLAYLEGMGALRKTKINGVYWFETAYTGFSTMGARDDSVQKECLIPFHFIPAKPMNQLPEEEKATDPTVYRCKAADRDNGLLINKIVSDFVEKIRQNKAGRSDEWAIELGLLLHVYADTFAHENFSGREGIENWCSLKECYRVSSGVSERVYDITMLPPIGHAQAAHLPDVLDLQYTAGRKDGNGNTCEEIRNNKERFEMAARNIFEMFCRISGKSFSESEWDRLYQRIWYTSARVVGRVNETSKTSRLNKIWADEFADMNISYNYPEQNPYFELKGAEIVAIDNEGMEEAGLCEEDIREIGTARGTLARKYALAIYEPSDDYFLWNMYAYKHRKAVLEGMDAKVAILLGVPEPGISTSGAYKESKSSFNCPQSYQVIAGRKHDGDENGNTWYKYGELYVAKSFTAPSLVITGVRLSRTFYTDYMKESSSRFVAEDSIIVGREHSGDENGDTRYLYKKVFVRTAEGTYLQCKASPSGSYRKTLSVKENAGQWQECCMSLSGDDGTTAKVYLPMYGREHYGDEKGTTTTYLALFDIDQEKKAITEEEFNKNWA